MQIIADMHTHTIASTHAYSTVYEMARGARRKGLSAIAITDHGPDMPDAAHEWHFLNMNVIPRQIEGVTVIRGIEFNIRPGGELDHMQDRCLKHMEFTLASFHDVCCAPVSKAVHTEMWEKILHDKRVNALGHSGNPKYDFDKEYIISHCNEFGKVVEINNNSFLIRAGSRESCTEIARLCKKYSVPIVVDSDSHMEYMVGEVSEALAMLEEIDFPEELVINSSMERLDAYFRGRGLHLFADS